MRKFLCKSLVLLAAICFGTTNVAAQDLMTGTGTVKMTVVNYDDPEMVYGVLDTISVGYNKTPSVGGTIGWGNASWGVNKFGIMKADVSLIPGTVQRATLNMWVSGADDRRTTGWGVALTDNEWADDLSYATAGSWTVSALLNGGQQVWSTTKLKTEFNRVQLDVTEAFSGGQATATFIIFQTAAGVCYMTEPVLEVQYESFEATVTKYDFEDGTNIFTDDSRVSSAIAVDEVTNSNVTVFTAADNCQNGYGFAHYDFTDNLNQPANVSVEFDYYNESGSRAIITLGDRLVRMNDGGCTKNTYGSKGAVFRIGSDKSNFFINGINLPQADSEAESYAYDVDETGDTISVDTIKTTIPESRIDESVYRILAFKQNHLKNYRYLDASYFGSPEHSATVAR